MTEVLLLSQTLILDDNITHQLDLSTRPIKSVYYGTESLGYLGPKIWKLIPAHFKEVESLWNHYSVAMTLFYCKVHKYGGPFLPNSI